jgi:hypothetical protein
LRFQPQVAIVRFLVDQQDVLRMVGLIDHALGKGQRSACESHPTHAVGSRLEMGAKREVELESDPIVMFPFSPDAEETGRRLLWLVPSAIDLHFHAFGPRRESKIHRRRGRRR